MQTHMICTHTHRARYSELGNSEEQMSSVSDQLQRKVGKSHNTAAEEDKKKEGEEGRQRRKKVRRDESQSETGSGVEGTHTEGDTRERCQLRGRREKKGSM